mgnify:CR=1 FL=1
MLRCVAVSRAARSRSCLATPSAIFGLLIWLIAGMSCLAQPPNTAKLDTDAQLEGWWKFDDTAGTTSADAAKKNRPGKLEGDATFDKNSVSGRLGKALKLEGGNQLVRIPGYQGITGTSPRTIAIWIKTESPGGDIVSWGNDDFGQTFDGTEGAADRMNEGLYFNGTESRPLLEVGTGAKGFVPRPADHHYPHRRVETQGLDLVAQGIEQFEVQTVHHLGPVEGEPGHPLTGFGRQHRFAHECVSLPTIDSGSAADMS